MQDLLYTSQVWALDLLSCNASVVPGQGMPDAARMSFSAAACEGASLLMGGGGPGAAGGASGGNSGGRQDCRGPPSAGRASTSARAAWGEPPPQHGGGGAGGNGGGWGSLAPPHVPLEGGNRRGGLVGAAGALVAAAAATVSRVSRSQLSAFALLSGPPTGAQAASASDGPNNGGADLNTPGTGPTLLASFLSALPPPCPATAAASVAVAAAADGAAADLCPPVALGVRGVTHGGHAALGSLPQAPNRQGHGHWHGHGGEPAARAAFGVAGVGAQVTPSTLAWITLARITVEMLSLDGCPSTFYIPRRWPKLFFISQRLGRGFLLSKPVKP
jgi:hypothetical protein